MMSDVAERIEHSAWRKQRKNRPLAEGAENGAGLIVIREAERVDVEEMIDRIMTHTVPVRVDGIVAVIIVAVLVAVHWPIIVGVF